MVKSRSRQLFHPGVCVEDEDSHTAGGFAWKYSPLSECCNDNLFGHVVKTADTVISSQLVDRPPSLLPFPIDGHGQPLFSPESKSSHTGADRQDSQEAIFAVQNTGPPVVKSNGILHTPVSPHLAHSSCFSPFRRSDPPPSFTSTHFDDSSHSSLLHPSSFPFFPQALGLFSHALGSASDRNLCQDVCFLSGGKKQDSTSQKSKISGRYDEFAGCKNSASCFHSLFCKP